MYNSNETERQITIDLIRELIKDKYIKKNDIKKIISDYSISSQEEERIKMEEWYKTLGIERITKKPFYLSPPYFTDKEMQEIEEKNEFLLCLPAGLTAKDLSILFNMPSWVCNSSLVSQFPETEDLWFAVSKNKEPEYLDRTCYEGMRMCKKNGKLNMSLERYMVFCAYIYKITEKFPDQEYKVWLPNTRYEEKSMLIAGINSEGEFAAHCWLPQFHSPKVGVRYVRIAEHL